MISKSTALVVTADLELSDQVLAVAAAAGIQAETVADAASVRPGWDTASVVLVGLDQVEGIASLGLARRSGTYVVGPEAALDQLCRWSVHLGAAVAALPEAAGWLTAALADTAGSRVGRGLVVGVIGGSGGVGASTVAAGLTVVAARSGWRPVLVDGDPLGGGLDLLMGAEQVEGWRWPRLAGARGHLGDLSGQLPHVDGVDVLSVARRDNEGRGGGLGPEQLTSVLLSTARSHDLTVVDLPRADPSTPEVVRRLDQLMVVVRADVRGFGAAQLLLARLRERPALGLVLRTRRSVRSSSTVAERLQAPLLGAVSDDWGLRLAAERGEPPARSPRSQLARVCADLLEDLSTRRQTAA